MCMNTVEYLRNTGTLGIQFNTKGGPYCSTCTYIMSYTYLCAVGLNPIDCIACLALFIMYADRQVIVQVYTCSRDFISSIKGSRMASVPYFWRTVDFTTAND